MNSFDDNIRYLIELVVHQKIDEIASRQANQISSMNSMKILIADLQQQLREKTVDNEILKKRILSLENTKKKTRK
jgi:hypothetical protein